MDDTSSSDSGLPEQSTLMQIQALGYLPTPSSTAVRLYELMRSEDTGIPEMAAVIKGDVSLTARLLHMANRGGYAQRSVTSVEEALMRVGTMTVANLAIGLSVIDDAVKSPSRDTRLYLELCHQSLAAAVVAEWFCDRPGVPVSAADLFACALLARIGQLALLRFYPEAYADLLRRDCSPAERLELEREHLGIDHQAISLALLREWGFPDIFIDAIRLSETAEEARIGESRRQVMGQLLHNAWEIAPFLEKKYTAHLGLHVERALATMGLETSAGECDSIVARLLQRLKEWESTQQIDIKMAEQTETSTEEGQLSVLLVGVGEQERSVWGAALIAQGFAVADSASLHEAMVRVAKGGADILIIREAPNGLLSAAEVALVGTWLKDVPRAALVVVPDGGRYDEEHAVALLEAGVTAILPGDVTAGCLVAQAGPLSDRVALARTLELERLAHRRVLSELVLTTRKLHMQTLTDPLTGLANRRMADAFLKRHWAQLERRKTALSCLIIDLDNFKQINDRFGHDAGDSALRAFGSVLKHQVRQEDLAVRMGGDEFLVVCPMAHESDLQVLRQRLIKATAQLKLETGVLEFSMGIAESDLVTMKSPEDLLRAADQHLMQHKRKR